MPDAVREKCDLHIRAAGIFVMQLELLEIQRLVALCHNEGPIVTEEPILATAQRGERCWSTFATSPSRSGRLALSKGEGEGEGYPQQLTLGTEPFTLILSP